MTRKIARRGFDMHLAAGYQVWGGLLTPIILPQVVVVAGLLHGADGVDSTKGRSPADWQYCATGGNHRAAVVHITGAERIADMVAAAGSDPAGVIMAISLLVASDDPRVKHTLAICNANRHVGLAVLLSGQYLRPKESVPAIALHTVPAPCVIGWLSWRFRREKAMA